MNVQTLRKAIASVSATALLLTTMIVPGMGVNVAKAEWYDAFNDAASMSEIGGFVNASAEMTRGEFFELVVNAALVAGWIAAEDFTGNHAETLVDLDVIQGQGGTGNLDLNGKLTKEAALKVLMILVGLVSQDEEGTKSTTKFTDVPADSWFAIYVSVALDNGYIRGEGGGNSFGAGSLINNATGYKMTLATLEVADEATGELLVSVTLSDVLGDDVVTPVGNVTASLSANSPAGRTLAIGAAKAEVLRLRFSGTGTVKSVTFVKTSVANVASIANIYLFDPVTGSRLTDGFSLNSDGVSTIGGLNLVAPVEVAVVITVAGAGVATSGEEIQLGLKSFSVSGSGEQTPSTMIVGAVFRLATATIATYTTGPVTPTGGALNAGPEEQVVFQSSIAIAQRDVIFWQLILENIGSAPVDAFQDLRLLVDGVEVGTAAGLDENSRVVFTGGANGVQIKQGTRVFMVVAKVVKGANRTFQFSIRNPVDFEMVDPTVGSAIGNTAGGNATVQSAAASNINAGTCTVTKNPSSATGQLVLTATNVRLASFDVICYGEDVKANQMTAGFAYSNAGGNPAAGLRNGYIAIGMSGDGSKADQAGTTSQQGGNATLAQAGTVYNTNFVFEGGKHFTVEVFADTFNVGGNAFAAGETIQIMLVTGAANAQLQQSRGTINVPAANTTAATLTLATAAALAMVADANYPSQNTVFPSTRQLIAKFRVSNGNVENVNITGVTVALAGTLTAMNDLIVVFNGKQAPIQSTVGAGGTFAVSDVLKTNTTVTVEVFVTILGTAANAQAVTTTLTVNGTTALSGLAATTGAVGGQTITLAAGTITLTRGPNSVNASITEGNKTVVAYEADISTLNDSFTVNGLTIQLNNFTTVTAVNIKKGGTLVRTFAPAANTVLTGLELPAAKNVHSYFTIELVLGNVGTSAGTSGEAVVMTIAAATALNSNGTQGAVTLVAPTTSNQINVYAATPLVEGLSLPSTLLTAAADKVVAKFKVSGNVRWANFSMNVNKTGLAGGIAVTGCYVKKLSDNSTVPGTCTSVIADTAAAGTIVFAATNEENIPAAGESYEVHVTTTGAPSTGHTFSVTWPNSGLAPAAPNTRAVVAGTIATFVWSDASAAPHSLTSLDWNNDAFVKNLPITTWNMAN